MDFELYFERKALIPKPLGDKYFLGRVIGDGSYSKVKEGYFLEHGAPIAVKIMKLSRIRKIPHGFCNISSELAIYQRFFELGKNFSQNVPILNIIDVLKCENKGKIYVIMDRYCFSIADLCAVWFPASIGASSCVNYREDSLNMSDDEESEDINTSSSQKTTELELANGIPEDICKFLIRRVLLGLDYLHEHMNIVHNDIKESNLMLRQNDIKFVDFGVAQDMTKFLSCNEEEKALYDISDFFKTVGSPMYLAPELVIADDELIENRSKEFLQNPRLLFKIDIWAAGVALYYMLCGYYPFSGATIYLLLLNIEACNIHYPINLSYNCQEFLKQILTKNWISRPEASNLLQHTWLQMNEDETNEAAKHLESFITNNQDKLYQPSIFPKDVIACRKFILDSLPESFRVHRQVQAGFLKRSFEITKEDLQRSCCSQMTTLVPNPNFDLRCSSDSSFLTPNADSNIYRKFSNQQSGLGFDHCCCQ